MTEGIPPDVKNTLVAALVLSGELAQDVETDMSAQQRKLALFRVQQAMTWVKGQRTALKIADAGEASE